MCGGIVAICLGKQSFFWGAVLYQCRDKICQSCVDYIPDRSVLFQSPKHHYQTFYRILIT